MIRNGVIIVASLILLAGSASAQFLRGPFDSTHVLPQVTRFDFVGGGAKAEGMGNANIGLARGVSVSTWNPAGLNSHETISISYGHQVYIPAGNVTSTEVTFTQPVPGGFDPVVFSSTATEFDHDATLTNVNDLFIVAPVRIKGHKFVGSFGYYRAWDEYQNIQQPVSLEFTQVPNPLNLSDTRRLTAVGLFSEELTGGVDIVNFGFGTRLYKTFNFGAAVNVYSGQTERVAISTTMIENFGVLSGGGGGGIVVQDATFDEFVRITDTNKFAGVNFTIGGRYEGERVHAGLSIRTPFTLEVEKNTVKDSLGRFLGSGGSVPYDSLTQFTDDSLTQYEMPLMIGFGLGFQATEKLLVAVDLEYRGFSGKLIKKRTNRILNPGGSDIEEFVEIDPDWRNVFAFRGGLEYMLESGLGEIPLRAGGGYTPFPEGDAVGNPNQVHLSFGTGLYLAQIDLDFAYIYSTVEKDDTDNLIGVIPAEQSNKDHRFMFQFTGYF